MPMGQQRCEAKSMNLELRFVWASPFPSQQKKSFVSGNELIVELAVISTKLFAQAAAAYSMFVT
jgi:hypothetical protein